MARNNDPGGSRRDAARLAGVTARREERARGEAPAVLAPCQVASNSALRDAWLDGYQTELKARG
jgi:hypothetical protein